MGGSGEIVDRTQLAHCVVGGGLAVLLGNALVADQHHLPGDLGQRLTAPVEQVQIHRPAVVVNRMRRQTVARLQKGVEGLLEGQFRAPSLVVWVYPHRHIAQGGQGTLARRIHADHIRPPNGDALSAAVHLTLDKENLGLRSNAKPEPSQAGITI